MANQAPHAKSNSEVRAWYLEQIARIPELNAQWVAQRLPLRQRAEFAWRIRHDARLTARAMMANPEEVEMLRARDIADYGNPDGPSFEFLVLKLKKAGLEGDAAFEAIIRGSYSTNEEVNRRFGL